MVNGRHLILGELTDVITGRTLPDTHDERYRQKIARLLLEEKGYSRSAPPPRAQRGGIESRCAPRGPDSISRS